MTDKKTTVKKLRIAGDWDVLAKKLRDVIESHGDVDGWVPVGYALNVIVANPEDGRTRIMNDSFLMSPEPEQSEGFAADANSIGWALLRTTMDAFQGAIDDAVAEVEEESNEP